MLLRGLLVIASGFLFIFSPGLPMSLLARGRKPIDRNLLYWGIGLWLAALVPSLFLHSLLFQVFQRERGATGPSSQPVDYLLTLAAAFITALLVQTALAIKLRRRREAAGDRITTGMTLGFGMGLIAQVFTGLFLVGAGFQLIFGNTSTPALAGAAAVGLLDLCLTLLALVLFRPALLVVSAVQGTLVARSVTGGARFFWLAVLVDAAFAWTILALKMALGGTDPGQVSLGESDRLTALVTTLYYALAFGLAYRWLASRLEAAQGVKK